MYVLLFIVSIHFIANAECIGAYRSKEGISKKAHIFSTQHDENIIPIGYSDIGARRLRRSTNPIGYKNTKSRNSKVSLDPAHEPIINKVQLNDTHHQAMVDWAGKGSKVIVCVTKDNVQNKTSTTNIYLSYDYGSKFLNKNELFKMKDGKQGIISDFYKNEQFTDRFVFSDIINNYLFVTMDYGHTIFPRELSFTPSEVSTHPTNAYTLLALDTTKQIDGRKLWVSVDFGETWRVLSLYVKSYYWSEKVSLPTLYVEREEPNMDNSVIAFTTFPSIGAFKHSVVITGVKEFELKGNFLFAVKQNPHLLGSKSKQDTLELWISYKEGPFHLAEFPKGLLHIHYYIADVTDGQVMVCVVHETYSNLYVSSAPSPSEGMTFSLSLERILYFSPGTNWNNTWLSEVADEAFADLHRVKGLRGVFIASQLSSNFSVALAIENLTTVISFNQGAEWQPIKPPHVNMDGQDIDCDLKKGCSLHISQELSSYYPSSRSRMILTSESAPGIILATGTVGTSLKGKPGLYMSADAGISWYHMLKGYYLYAIGDHGGILIAVQHYRPDGETNEFIFSTDEGETWHVKEFHSEKLRVYGLMTEPGENTTIFTIFGSQPTKHEWIIVKIDMRPVFKYQCSKEDYKTWNPLDGLSGRPCLLGQKEIFERRIPHSNCYNGLNYDAPTHLLNCPCIRDDYECDFGYIIDPATSKCVNDGKSAAHVPFFACKSGQFYNKTKGYRLIHGDTCVGGKDFLYKPETTACPIQEEKEFLLLSNRKSILRYDLMNPDDGLQRLPLQGLDSAIALDFSLKTNCLYWSNINTKTIMRQCFDGQHPAEIVVQHDLKSVEGIALDWISSNLYFVDGGQQTIEVVHINETGPVSGWLRKTLLNSTILDSPRGIALHPVRGYLFFTDWSHTRPIVGRLNLDGSAMKILFDKKTVGWPNGIAVDFETDRIYWADAKKDYIASASFDGSDFHIVISNEFVKQVFAVAVYKSLLFWDDWSMYQVFQADKEHGWGVTPLSANRTVGLVDLKVFGHWTQTGSNACGAGHTCEYICAGRPDNDYSCLCPNWMKTIGDGNHKKCVCLDGSKPNDSGLCPAEGKTCASDMFTCENNICIPTFLKCNGVNNCGDSSDEKQCSPSSCAPPSWQCKNGRCISPGWKCDSDNDCGDNSDEEGCNVTTCSSEQFTCKNKRCINKSYVCDMQNDCFDGSDESNCTHTTGNRCRSSEFTCNSTRNCLPLSWKCDKEQDCKDGSDELDCDNHKCETWQFMCGSKKCIFNTWRCDGEKDCPDGSDEVNCTTDHRSPFPIIPFTLRPIVPASQNHNCSSYDFRCTNGNCIPFWWRCEGVDDCGDGSDEENCEGRTSTDRPTTPKNPGNSGCLEDQMQCSNGQCIWQAYVCDGENDCQSGEDEKHCSATHCSPDEFRCIHSRGCISRAFVCNGKQDCADGSDELGCLPITESTNIVHTCINGFFMCDGGTCLKTSKICDGNPDCFDMTDEAKCTDHKTRIYQTSNLIALQHQNTSIKLGWDLITKGSDKKFEFLPSCIIKASFGNPTAWKNATWITEKIYDFKNLEPDTLYVFKVYVRDTATEVEFYPAESVDAKTRMGVPTAPKNLQLGQEGENLRITWDPPLKQNGVISYYTLYISPPTPAKTLHIENANFFLLSLESLQDLSIWISASNGQYTSNISQIVSFSPSKIDQIVNGLSIVERNMTTISLVWNKNKEIDGYNIKYFYPENPYVGSRFSQNVTDNNFTLTNLAPGLKYIFEVRSYKGNFMAPFSQIEVTTLGQKLTPIDGILAQVSEDPGTKVELSWEKPHYQKNYAWKYSVIWGKTMIEIKQKKNSLTTTSTNMTICNLDACEEYLVIVMIAGPIGYGPVKHPITFSTKEDKLAPPKKVHSTAEDDYMQIMWQPPCPEYIDTKLRYLLNITEMNHLVSSYIELPSSANLKQMHHVKMHVGGQYRITIKTTFNASRESTPTYVNATMIPSPRELTYTPSDGSFFWRNSKLPPQMYHQNFTYLLYLNQEDQDNQSEEVIPVTAPPYIASELNPGQIYFASVALKDNQGYLSPRSSAIRVERSVGDSLVITKTNVVGVAVVVLVVVALLVVIVGVLAVRHRRLARSFLMFANTHYDRSHGTTIISTTDNGLDDDDSPMIRGFSDDEPLVIA